MIISSKDPTCQLILDTDPDFTGHVIAYLDPDKQKVSDPGESGFGSRSRILLSKVNNPD